MQLTESGVDVAGFNNPTAVSSMIINAWSYNSLKQDYYRALIHNDTMYAAQRTHCRYAVPD